MALRIGTLGATRIGPKALYAPAAARDDVEVVAVAARDRNRAATHAAEHGIAIVADSYEDLIADPHIDAVYVPTPAALHARWTIAALDAGKHVLVEKPFASNGAEARQMVDAAADTGLVLLEAFHWRFHPLAERMVQITATLGSSLHLDAVFNVPHIPVHDIRYQLLLGGGALMDLGCYPVHWARTLLGAPGEVATVRRSVIAAASPGVDEETEADLEFADGSTAHIASSMHEASELGSALSLAGSAGTMTVTNPVTPQNGHQIRIERQGEEPQTESVDDGTSYGHQLDAFVRAITLGDEPAVTLEDSVANMDTIDAIYRRGGSRRHAHPPQ